MIKSYIVISVQQLMKNIVQNLSNSFLHVFDHLKCSTIRVVLALNVGSRICKSPFSYLALKCTSTILLLENPRVLVVSSILKDFTNLVLYTCKLIVFLKV